MAVGTRIRQDFIEGTLVSNLSETATAMESDGLADLVVIDHATNGEYAAAVIRDEVVHIVTHNSAATTAQIEREQEGTAAGFHESGTPWHHGPTEVDFIELQSGGQATGSGDGAVLTFSFAHGLNFTPTAVVVSAGSADASGDFYVTFDATNITVTYVAAPPAGTDNLTWNWLAV